MPSGSPINRGQLRSSLALLAILALACSNTTITGKGDGGDGGGYMDSGPSWLHVCGTVGASCSGTQGDCCTNLTCQNGACGTPAPSCSGYLEACGSGQPACCEPSGSSPLLTCSTLNDAGLSLCLAPSGGSACTSDADCPSPYWCVQSICNIATNKADCNNKPAGSCVLGDICVQTNSELSKVENGGDPCLASGLVCLIASTDGICVPQSVEAPGYWSPDGDPFDYGICNPADSKCEAYYTGADQQASVCAPFFLTADRCVESCNTGDDCDNIAWDCVNHGCMPNYCFAAGHNITNDAGWAGYLTPFQTQNGGLTISDDPHVLFNLCPEDAGFPTVCLPQYDDLLGVSTGECVRVGGAGSGGWGDPCDPNPYRNNLGGLCGFGTYCQLGTCMPWCDIGSPEIIQCPAGTLCQPMPTGPLSSTTTGSTNAIGVCAVDCNPYTDDTQNSCQAFPTDGGQAGVLGCKLSGNGSDTSPAPGNCVALVDSPIAVGQTCAPFGWIDPCVSGAQCVQVADAGVNFVCRQICDPEPSTNAPATITCPSGQSCVKFTNCSSGVCSHVGDCE